MLYLRRKCNEKIEFNNNLFQSNSYIEKKYITVTEKWFIDLVVQSIAQKFLLS